MHPNVWLEKFAGKINRKNPRRDHTCAACGKTVPKGTKNALAAEVAIMENSYVCSNCEHVMPPNPTMVQWTIVTAHRENRPVDWVALTLQGCGL